MDKSEELRLKEFLEYLPYTGEFIWKKTASNRAQAGSVAGTLNNDGYCVISLQNKLYLAHRLAFLFVEGYIPEFVDHKNGVSSDNRFCNLRGCTIQENNWNTRISNKNTSGVKNVFWSKQKNKWFVKFKINKKQIHIGFYEDFELAKIAADYYRTVFHKEFSVDGRRLAA